MATPQLAGAAPIVTISIPAKVAYDLDAMQSVIKEVAGRLGCEQCHSGYDFRFRHALDFVVNPKGAVREAGLGWEAAVES
jgi:hypothetical protein